MKVGSKLYLILTILIISCNNNQIHVKMRTIQGNTLTNAQFYEIYYFKDSISLELKEVSRNSVNYKYRTFVKKDNEYYVKNSYPKELNNGKSYNLILSKEKDTVINYNSAGNINKIEIQKIRESLYKSTFQISGISNFSEIIYFDEDYKILKIERKPNNEEYLFVLD